MKRQTCILPLIIAVLVFTSCTSRIGSPPATRPFETAARTLQKELTATPTANLTPESFQKPASTGIPELEPAFAGGDPDLDSLLLVTPDSQSGVIYPETYLHADAGNYSLQPGQMVTLRWDGYPIMALSYHFFLKPHTGGSYLSIGIDRNSEDGVAVEWLVPENLAGDLYGIAIYEDGGVEAAFISAAVYSGTVNGSSNAVNVLKEYFRTLSQGEYKAASDLFGGDYSILEEYNPDLNPADRAGLLERACTINGYACLPVLKVESVEPLSDSVFLLVVSFKNTDGSTFIRGACCGNSEEENESQAVFDFQVKHDSRGSWLVMDLPVYVP